MDRRNWLNLARKLVDRFDMDYTVGALQAALGEASLSFFGEGVLVTTLYPNPFPITLSGSVLGGGVGTGIGYDPQGQITKIETSSPSYPGTFTIPTSDPTNPRWDLLVIRYKATGQTAIPKPSDPISSTFLNLVDDFELAVVPGTPSSSPVYPSKGSLDIILAGIQVPAGATLGTQCALDLNQREQAQAFAPNQSVFKSEPMVGTVNGINKIFTISEAPQTALSLIAYLDGIYVKPTDYSISGTTITFVTAPAPGQQPEAWYIANSPMSENPLSGVNQSLGIGDGVTTMFTMPGSPPNKDALQIFLDGLQVEPSEYSFGAGTPNSTITFLNPPAVGQDVGSFYLVNSNVTGSGASGVQSVSNVGTGAGQVAEGITGTLLKLRNIKAGLNVTVTQVGDDIVIASTGGGGGGGGSLTPNGGPTSPDVIGTSGIPAPSTTNRTVLWLVSTGGQVTAMGTQVGAGTNLGQELILFGTSDTDYLTLNDGAGLALNGSVNLKNNVSIYLVWNGSVWAEISRR